MYPPSLDYSRILIDLKYLQILRVHGGGFVDLFADFQAPALEELHIKEGPDGRTPIRVHWGQFRLHCLHLYALLPWTIRVAEPV